MTKFNCVFCHTKFHFELCLRNVQIFSPLTPLLMRAFMSMSKQKLKALSVRLLVSCALTRLNVTSLLRPNS